MSSFRAILWCTAVEKPVEVSLADTGTATQWAQYVPTGWKVQKCFGRQADCPEEGCPFRLKDGNEAEAG